MSLRPQATFDAAEPEICLPPSTRTDGIGVQTFPGMAATHAVPGAAGEVLAGLLVLAFGHDAEQGAKGCRTVKISPVAVDLEAVNLAEQVDQLAQKLSPAHAFDILLHRQGRKPPCPCLEVLHPRIEPPRPMPCAPASPHNAPVGSVKSCGLFLLTEGQPDNTAFLYRLFPLPSLYPEDGSPPLKTGMRLRQGGASHRHTKKPKMHLPIR